MLRAVLDSNVYVSAFHFGGAPRAILQLAAEGAFALYISPPIAGEVRRVLTNKFHWTPAELVAGVEPILSSAPMVRPNIGLKVAKDPDDNRVLECALAARAHVLVTGDEHLLVLGSFQDTRIMKPRAFLSEHPWTREG